MNDRRNDSVHRIIGITLSLGSGLTCAIVLDRFYAADKAVDNAESKIDRIIANVRNHLSSDKDSKAVDNKENTDSKYKTPENVNKRNYNHLRDGVSEIRTVVENQDNDAIHLNDHDRKPTDKFYHTAHHTRVCLDRTQDEGNVDDVDSVCLVISFQTKGTVLGNICVSNRHATDQTGRTIDPKPHH